MQTHSQAQTTHHRRPTTLVKTLRAVLLMVALLSLTAYTTACSDEESGGDNNTTADTTSNTSSDTTSNTSSDTNTSGANTNTTAPDVNGTTPDTNETAPDVNGTTPDTNETAADTNATASDTNATASDTSATASDTSATASDTSATASDTSGDTDTTVTPLPDTACHGYATRYWDCCKSHCGWAANVPSGVSPVTSCNQSDAPLTGDFNAASSCDVAAQSSAYTCYSMAPWVVSPTLSYGFAAVPATGDICGRCYQLEFDGTSHNAGADAGSAALSGKTMIVQATNIGFDVGNGQFDILIPGGGVGIFDACSRQWGASGGLGATYGGFLAQCKQDLGNNSTPAQYKSCVRGHCDRVFSSSAGLSDLHAACLWFVDWYEVADNPSLSFQEVECPQGIVDVSGVDRRPLNDIQPCTGGGSGGTCTPEQQAQCDCSWTNGGASCGTNDGSCCWQTCCGG
jgi:hypothetical protein